jgi:large subunit ribosomal protein LP0
MADAESSKLQRKQKYFSKLIKLLDEYPKIILVSCTNVGSYSMQKIRKSLREDAVLLMGKNTMIRMAIKSHLDKNPNLKELLPFIKGNIGFVFTKGDLASVRTKLLAEKVFAPAKVGAIAPCDVILKAGPTNLEPTKTSFFQALNIASKINRGQIEISNDVHLIKKGDKVGTSEATLLQMLNIKPFQYGLVIKKIYDNGIVYDESVLDITDEDILNRFRKGIANVACISLGISFPTAAAVPHVLANGFKNILAIALATNVTFKQAEKVRI